jgi:hypothetical protein
MKLISLKTENFKRLGDFSCSFTDGLNIIAGGNFQGKSTLLKAIKVALFGATAIPGKKEDIPTWGQTNFSLTLEFQLGSKVYVVTRNKSTAKLMQDAELLANGNTPVSAAVLELLELTDAKDYDLFIQAKQGAIAGVLEYGATALNRKVEEFAGVDLIEKVQQRAQQLSQHLASVAEAKMPADGHLEELQGKALDAEGDEFFFVGEVKKAKDALDACVEPTYWQLTRSYDELRDDLAAAERLLAKWDAAEIAVATAKTRVEDAQKALAALGEMVDLEQGKEKMMELRGDADALLSDIKDMQAKQTAHVRAASVVKAAQDNVTAAQAKVAQHQLVYFDDLGPKVEAKQTEWQAAKDEHAAALLALRSAKELVDRLSTTDECPTCHRAYDEHDPELRAEELRVATEAHDRAECDVDDAALLANGHKAVLDELTAEHRANVDALAKLTHANQALAEAKEALELAEQLLAKAPAADAAELEQYQDMLQDKREGYAVLQNRLKAGKDTNDRIAAARVTVTVAENQLLDAQAKLDEVTALCDAADEQPTEEDLEHARRVELANREARAEYLAKKGDLQRAYDKEEHTLEMTRVNLKQAREALQAITERTAEAKEAASMAHKYKLLVQFLRERRQGYLKEVWDVITGVSSALINEASDGAITQVINREGDFLYVENGVEVPAVEASGAQAAFLGTGLRIGLTRALYGRDSLLIFDEPTAACTEDNASALSAMLATSAKQTLLITHRENDQVLAQNVINVGV